MKVMRYGSKYRYGSSQPNKKIIAIIACVLILAVLTALVVVYAINFNKKADDNGAISLKLTEGEPIRMEVRTGDVCMLNMPSSVDVKEVRFESSDPAVVRVDDAGHVDALAVGTAAVTAAARNFSAKCEFTVEKNPEPAYPDEVTTAIKANEDVLAANIASGAKDILSLTVNRRTNTVTAYTKDKNGAYSVPVRAMVCSCGTGGSDITVTGDFSIYFREAWHALYGDVYGMYVSGFSGPYLFHSVPYLTPDHDALETEEFNKLGTSASQGCVRLMASDASWIWSNCEEGTPVHVIDADEKADPLGKPVAVKLPANAKWDPTDDKETNPYFGKMPTFKGITDVELKKGEAFQPMAGVSAADICGNDITDRVKLAGEVISDKPGTYYLTYTVTDDFNLKIGVTRTVTVKE